MSRSRRKTAGYSHKDTLTKKKFNRSIRRNLKQAKLLEDDEGFIEMSFNIGNGREFRKHNCSWDIRDHHGLWFGGYKEYTDSLAYWEKLYPQWPDFYADTWYREIMK